MNDNQTEEFAFISRWIPGKGYGFATVVSNDEIVFVHVSAFDRKIKPNADLTGCPIYIAAFELGDKGKKATKVTFSNGLIGLWFLSKVVV